METRLAKERQEEHDAYYKVKHEEALFYQDFVVDLLIKELGLAVSQYASREYQYNVGESRQGIEIKHDWRYSETSNLFIETAETTKPGSGLFVPSGICRNDNNWLYVIGDYDTVFIYSTAILLLLKKRPEFPIRTIDRESSQGFLLLGEYGHPHKYAAKVLEPNMGANFRNKFSSAEQGAPTVEHDYTQIPF